MIEALLQRQLSEDKDLGEMLASYGGESAVFYQKAPMDVDPMWDGLSFPRVHYNLDFTYDPERKVSGVLSVDLWACSLNHWGDGRSVDRVIAERLEELISGVFYSGEGACTYCAIWRDSVSFVGQATSLRREASPVETFGITVTFDLIAFPVQAYDAPDPVWGLNLWVKENFPEVMVLGLEEIPEIWHPTAGVPLLYWRMTGTEVQREVYSCVWYLGEFYGHLYCDTEEKRNALTRRIVEGVKGGYDLPLEDGSYLRVEKVSYGFDGNPLTEGQIALLGEFGQLSKRYVDGSGGAVLREAMMRGKGGEVDGFYCKAKDF